jgi:hypothetical protein
MERMAVWSMARLAPLALAAGLSVFASGSCGGSAKGQKDAVATIGGRLRGDGDEDGQGAIAKERAKADVDGDGDNEGTAYYDWDDSHVLAYGHPASIAEERAIDAAVVGYYAAAAASDGTRACHSISTGMVKTVRDQLSRSVDPSASRKRPCAATMSKALARLHVDFERVPKVGIARVEGDQAYVPLASGATQPNRYTVLHREHGAWKVDSLLDIGLP